jgi:hypothetical protein
MSGHLQADIHPHGRRLDRLYFLSAPFGHSPIVLIAAAFRPPLQPLVSKTPSTADVAHGAADRSRILGVSIFLAQLITLPPFYDSHLLDMSLVRTVRHDAK